MPAFTPIGVEAIVRNFGKFNKDLRAMNKAIQQSGKHSEQAAKATKRFNTTLTSLSAGGLDMVLRSLLAFGKAIVEEGAAFDKAMSNVKAISGATASEFQKLEQQAVDLGSTTKFTAIEAAEGMSFLAMAGFETSEIIGAMPGTLNLAAAANLDLSKSADIVSNILQGFGASAESTNTFVDILTKTFTTSNTNLVQLGQAMKFAAPVAHSLGVTVEDTAAAIGTLSNAGIQGTLAGTNLRGIMLSLAKPTKAAKNVMDELGISVFDAEGNMRPFPEIIGQVERATAGMTEEQRNATLHTIVGMKRLAGFNVLLEAGEAGLQSYGDELRDSMGTATEIANKQLDNLSGDFTLFQSAVSGFKIGAFKLLEPSLRDATQAATELVIELGKGAQAWKWIFEMNAALNEAAGEAEDYDNKIAQWAVTFQNVASAVNPVVGMIMKMARATQDQTRATESAIFSTEEYRGAFRRVDEAIESVATTTQIADQQTMAYGESMKTFASDFAESTVRMTEEAIESARVQREMLADLRLSQAGYYNSVREFQDDATQNEADFNAKMADIRTGAADKQAEAQKTLAEKLVEIEQQREEKLAWVMTGAHARTEEENAAALAHWNAHYDELKTTAETKTQEKTDAILAEQSRAESAAAAAREKEKAEMAAHLEELKLKTVLAMMETTGQLEQMTGLVGISAGDAAELISAGVLPVTQEMGMAIQGVMGNMETSMAAASETATANQEILQAALGGTLTGAQELGTGMTDMLTPVEDVSTAIAGIGGGGEEGGGGAFGTLPGQIQDLSTEFSTNLPTNIATTDEAILLFSETAVVNLQPILDKVTELNDLFLDTYSVKLPALQQMTMITSQVMVTVITEVNGVLSEMNALIVQITANLATMGEAAKTMIDEMKKISEVFSKYRELKTIVDKVAEAFDRLATMAQKANDAMADAGRRAESKTGIGFRGGLGLQAGVGANTGGPLGLGYRIPPGYPNDSFGPLFVESGEEMLVTPRGMSIEGLIFSRLAGLMGNTTNNTTNFDMTVNSGASAQSVVQQFEVMRALVG